MGKCTVIMISVIFFGSVISLMAIPCLDLTWHDAHNIIVQLFNMSICGQKPASGISLFKHVHPVIESHVLRASF